MDLTLGRYATLVPDPLRRGLARNGYLVRLTAALHVLHISLADHTSLAKAKPFVSNTCMLSIVMVTEPRNRLEETIA